MGANVKGYNGWANYETWCVALWIDNDEGTYRQARDMVAAAIEEAPSDSRVDSGVWTVAQAEKFNLAETIRDWVADELVPDLGASMAQDLMGAALSEVDWQEIAENWLSDAPRAEAIHA